MGRARATQRTQADNGQVSADELVGVGVRRLRAASDRLGWAGDLPDQARELLAHALGREPDDGEPVPLAVHRRYERLLSRRSTGEPLAYIVGWAPFRGMRIGVKSGVFVPRATSEFLAEQAIRRLRRRRDPVSVDLATGAAPVALSIARAVPKVEAYGTDLAEDAVRQARRNARELGIPNAHFRVGSLFEPLPSRLRGRVDVVTIHPPYVPRGDIGTLPLEIRSFEPRHTLTDRSHDGLELVRRVVEESREWLRPGGWLLIEIMPAAARATRGLLVRGGYDDVRSTHGEMRWTRVLVGRA